MRASAAVEKAGVPAVSLVCEGFTGQAAATALGIGMPNIPIAGIPSHVDAQTKEELENNVKRVTLDAVVKGLTQQPAEPKQSVEPEARDIAFKGTFEEVNRFFLRNQLSDGLPIVPPTLENVEEFGAFSTIPSHSSTVSCLTHAHTVTAPDGTKLELCATLM